MTMKKLISFTLTILLIFSLSGCNKDNQKADECAASFVEAMLLRDEKAMTEYAHPDYIEEAIPDDDFYIELEKNHFFTLGNELTAISAMEKSYVNDTSIDGTLMECIYVVRTNELFYDVELMILDNDKGYGVIAISAKLNTNPEFYGQSTAK